MSSTLPQSAREDTFLPHVHRPLTSLSEDHQHEGDGAEKLAGSEAGRPVGRASRSKYYDPKSASLHNKRAPSAEFLEPRFDDPSRQSSSVVAIFNIVATIVGGGTLSLPFAVSKTGWGLGLICLVLSAFASDFTLYILCSCSRRTGARTYQGIARHCYGPKSEALIMSLLLLFLLMVLMAFMILTSDTVTDLIEFVSGAKLSGKAQHMVLAGVLWLAFPLCLCRSMHSLRYTCYLGFASVLVLAISIFYRSIGLNVKHPARLQRVKMWPDQWTDALLVWPIYILSFMCTFNVLPVHASLVDPTRDRLKYVIHTSLLWVFVMYTSISIGGYMYALDSTSDDIFNNFPSSDRLLLIGRAGLTATLFFSLPLLVLPMREVAIDLIDKIQRWVQRKWKECRLHGNSSSSTAEGEKRPLVREGQVATTSLVSTNNGSGPFLSSPSTNLLSPSTSLVSGTHAEDAFVLFRHFLVTLFLMMLAYHFAISVPGVAFIWSLCGSSMGFLLCLAMPSAFYLKIRHRKRHLFNKTAAWIVLVGSLISIVVCTPITIISLLHPEWLASPFSGENGQTTSNSASNRI